MSEVEELKTLRQQVKVLEQQISHYEQNGAAKLFYAINRKMSEMASLMNKTNLSTIDLDDKESKSFDRMFKLLEKSQVISAAAQTIQSFAGITGNESADTTGPTYRKNITPESIANDLGNTAGKQN